MRERRLRDLFTGPAPGPERIFWAGLWFAGHNNPRYSELLPRLERLDAYYMTTSAHRIRRGLEYRAYVGPPGPVLHRALAGTVAKRYGWMLVNEFRQIPHLRGRVVVDVDDTWFRPDELALFSRPNVVALVTTTEWAIERFREGGVTAPIHVIPQGATFRQATDEAVAEARLRRRGGPVAAYAAAYHFSAGDRGAVNKLYNADHLLDLWDGVRERVPDGELWLIGEAGDALQRRVQGRDDVVLLGRLPREEVVPILAAADVGLYPRRERAGLAVVKVSDYFAAGLPVVSYDEENVARQVGDVGGGLVVSTERDFVDAVARLLGDEESRRPFAEAARAAGAELDWDVLARRYETEILDRYCPADPAAVTLP